jgi:hypothetical protein
MKNFPIQSVRAVKWTQFSQRRAEVLIWIKLDGCSIFYGWTSEELLVVVLEA